MSNLRTYKRVALVYDWIHTFGGAERVLIELHKLFPAAPLYTAIYNEKTASWANIFKIETSFLQYIPLAKSHHELFPLLTPLAFETFNFSEFDVVISVCSADSKGIITSPNTLHISYLLTPTRYLWSHKHFYLNNRLFNLIAKPAVNYLQRWDLITKNRPDYLIAISKTVQTRVKKYYWRESSVIYPPVVDDLFQPRQTSLKEKNYYLIVSRLVPYKKIDLVINVCNKLRLPLVIIGVGRAYSSLERQAGPTIKFLGNLTDSELISYYQNCRALIMPSEEDFGIVSVEAQAAGKPVIAYGKGGARETVKESVTGIFFEKQNETSLIEAFSKFEKMSFVKQNCQNNSKLFSRARFRKEFSSLITDYQTEYFGIIN